MAGALLAAVVAVAAVVVVTRVGHEPTPAETRDAEAAMAPAPGDETHRPSIAVLFFRNLTGNPTSTGSAPA